MKPILFEIFGFDVYGYGLMIAIGILSAVFLFTKRAKKRNYDEDKIFNMTIIAIIAGILGGKILYIITDFKYVIEDPSVVFRDFGLGFVIYGAIIAGVLSVYLYCRAQKWNALEVFDLVVPGLALAQGFGRIGCFFAGCCYGAETHSHIGIIFPKDSLAPSGVPLYPTQLMSSGFDFLLAIFLLWYDRKNNKSGRVFAMYLILYSIGRFFVEFLRNDPRGNVGVLSTSQFIAIITLILGLAIFNIHKIRGRMIKGEK
ncbi:prolipoprotein diacylglyceryl transferase [Clostridium fallax]|uniref:Phosphatidylglycerol--prolipoprotein diacylglyceryl transferase n=1 Tax=Clostridium fallax TaxID=1533 RepID=A0A1M4TBF3_9CLOT|nr:prolipoprotein diacylglyceryl transferase [Clostridium fallax]SHE41725.1 Prolipoprotein diacylglyceryl transferase [Clostridium fallax]SQB22684.1 prolipoprotein diacylglyceryl transferase [Clostridium fallax]